MVDISSQNNKINVTVSSSGNTANTNVTPDYAQYYSEKSKEWAISNRIVDNTDYSSKYYANESKKQADISTAKATEVITSGNTAVSNIENARDNAITNVNTAGATQVALATEQATIATNKTSEVVASGNEALSNIDTAKNNAITSITNQETTSKTSLIDEGATQIGLIQNEGATQVANVQSTGFYMRDDKLYFINSQGEETEFKSGGGLEVCDIGMALYVDETKGLRRYLNGQIVDINTNTQAFLNRLLEIKNTNPDYFTDEATWQSEATLNIDGCVYKFVLNYADDGETVVSVRLPKYPDYVEINAGGTLPVVGNGMSLGFTNSDLNLALGSGFNGSGYVIAGTGGYGKPVGTITSQGSATTAQSMGVTTDPTKSGIQTTLKQTKLKMRYFIQIATGAETEANITNKFENTNPQTLLESKYSDKPLYNESWLLSNGQYNAKAVYPTVYEGLQVEYNTEIEAGTTVTLPSGVSYTKRGLSVKLSTETYTDYDFVLNTANETFRLPIKNGMEGIFASGVKGNGKALGFTDGTSNYGLAPTTNTENNWAYNTGSYNQTLPSTTWNSTRPNSGTVLGITTDPTKSGLVVDTTVPSGWNLYFYVGDIDQNHGIVNMGRIGEQLANKQDKCIHITKTYQNGGSGYRIWSDGYCHQWGLANSSGVTVTLLKPMSNTDYHINLGGGNSTAWGNAPHSFTYYNITTTTFQIRMEEGSTLSPGMNCNWDVFGYLARGEY